MRERVTSSLAVPHPALRVRARRSRTRKRERACSGKHRVQCGCGVPQWVLGSARVRGETRRLPSRRKSVLSSAIAHVMMKPRARQREQPFLSGRQARGVTVTVTCAQCGVGPGVPVHESLMVSGVQKCHRLGMELSVLSDPVALVVTLVTAVAGQCKQRLVCACALHHDQAYSNASSLGAQCNAAEEA